MLVEHDVERRASRLGADVEHFECRDAGDGAPEHVLEAVEVFVGLGSSAPVSQKTNSNSRPA